MFHAIENREVTQAVHWYFFGKITSNNAGSIADNIIWCEKHHDVFSQ